MASKLYGRDRAQLPNYGRRSLQRKGQVTRA